MENSFFREKTKPVCYPVNFSRCPGERIEKHSFDVVSRPFGTNCEAFGNVGLLKSIFFSETRNSIKQNNTPLKNIGTNRTFALGKGIY